MTGDNRCAKQVEVQRREERATGRRFENALRADDDKACQCGGVRTASRMSKRKDFQRRDRHQAVSCARKAAEAVRCNERRSGQRTEQTARG